MGTEYLKQPQWGADDISFMNDIIKDMAKRYNPLPSPPNIRKGEQTPMNAYERVSIQKIMNVEYGSAATIEQLIMAQAYFQVVVNQIKTNGHDVPKDLQEALDATTRDLNDKLRADRRRQIKALEIQREQLLSADEKRSKIEAELAKLRELVK